MDPTPVSIGAMKASGASLDDYLRAQRRDDTPPGATPYSAGMANSAYSNLPTAQPTPATGLTIQQRIADLAGKTKDTMLRVLGLDKAPSLMNTLIAPVMPKDDTSAMANRTADLEKNLNTLQARSTLPQPPTPNLYSLRTAQIK